ncbi:MAG TPA: hypothetical protein VER96_25680 [Polyangiaceae bacterium]|nr:hypothetical protein [Polyangiaceae bacterium]
MPVIVEEVSVEALPAPQAGAAAITGTPAQPSDSATIAAQLQELPRLLVKLREREERVRAH